MKELNRYINEKLVVNNTIQNEYSSELKSVLDHFDFNHLYEIDRDRLEHEPYITKEEGEEIINKINDFLIVNNADVKKFKYYCPRGMHFSDPKIEKDFRKNTSDFIYTDKLNYADDTEIIFTGRAGLEIKASSKQKQIEICGPYGGAKLCCLETPYK